MAWRAEEDGEGMTEWLEEIKEEEIEFLSLRKQLKFNQTIYPQGQKYQPKIGHLAADDI